MFLAPDKELAYKPIKSLPAPSFLSRQLVADEGSGEIVLLETLSPQLCQALELKLFMQDSARVLSHKKLEGVPEIREIGTHPRLGLYLLYAYVPNISLSAVLEAIKKKELKLSPDYAASIMFQASNILLAAARQDCHHFALNPDHILIDMLGNVSVTGFIEASLRKRFALPSCGEPKFDAPEIRQNGEWTSAVDIYSLGAMVYQLLTQRTQPDEWEPRWMGMMMDLDNAQIPGDALTKAIEFFQRSLAERPSQRFSKLETFVEALQSLISKIGNIKENALIAETLGSLFKTPTETILLIDESESIPSCVCLEKTKEIDSPIDSPQTTRIITKNSGDFRSISPALRAKIQPSTLEILSRSRYQILEELGSGGTGSVYKVLDTTLAEILALKVLRPEFTNDFSWLQRFKRELMVTRDLDHEYILPAYHLEQIEGLYFFTMRYIEGQNLYQKLKANALSYSECLYILTCAAQALREAHSKGIIHRDFKTANIMIENGTGRPYLMDFGIAQTRENLGLTIAGQGIGTPYYMAPEQSRGETISEQADIYSFGVVAYECFARRLPFDGPTTIAIYTAQLSGVFQSLREIDPTLPLALDELVALCLKVDAKQRPKSMDQIIKTLERLPTR